MATYYVRATGGSDGNTGLSFAQGWATLNYALLTLVSGSSDTLYICSDASNKFTENGNLPVQSGSSSTPSQLIGADLITGAAYNGTGKAYMVCNNTVTSFLNASFGQSHVLAFDLHIDGGNLANNCFYSITVYQNVFTRCQFTNAKQYCFAYYHNTSSTIGAANYYLLECSFDNNTNALYGGCIFEYTSSYGAHSIIDNCNFYENIGSGLVLYASLTDRVNTVVIKESRMFNNGSYGLYLYNYVKPFVSNSIFHNNVSDGVYFDGGYTLMSGFYNNILTNNGGYGFNVNILYHVGDIGYIDYNCYYNNTSGRSNRALPGANDVLSDPLFVSITPGSEDFSLQATSPLLDVGYGFVGGQ